MKLNPQYLVDPDGSRRGVILPIEEYQRLLEIVEDHLDAADLDEAASTETDFAAYEQVQADLRREGRL